MPRLYCVLGVFVALCQPAKALYFLYPEWSALPETTRAVYIAGAFDSLVSHSTDENGRIGSKHFDRCVVGAHMTIGQLSTNVMNFAAQKPELHTLPMPAVMSSYLLAACGSPFKQTN
jgi:hypothetical protein